MLNKKPAAEKELTAEQLLLRDAFTAALEESAPRGVTPKVIADACEISVQAVYGWRTTGKINKDHLPTISALTGWSIQELLTNRRGQPTKADASWTLSPDEQDLVLAFRDIEEGAQKELLAEITAQAERTRAHVKRILLERFNITDYVPDESVAKAFKNAPIPTVPPVRTNPETPRPVKNRR